jgi:D-alanyl-D-alanine carboxypeptidase (penicillin-binding protein 5/6)
MITVYVRIVLIISLAFLSVINNSLAYETKAKQALLMDYDTQEVLYELHGQDRMAPSSMSKIMTAYVVFDYLKKGRLKLDDSFQASEKAWSKKGSSMFVPVGRYVSIEELLYGLIVQSGNDAAIILAEGISGSEEEFALLLNDYARKMGLKNSNFVNATGWPDPEHYTSCGDLAVIAYRTIIDFPDYYKFYKIPEFTYNNIVQYNRNTLVMKNSWVDGLKTGHTEIAGYGLVASGVRNGRRLIAVVNGLDSEKNRILEAETLLNYGFTNFRNVLVASADAPFLDVTVYGGVQNFTKVGVDKDIVLPTPSHQTDKYKISYKIKTPLIAPVTKGEEVGELIVEKPDNLGQHSFKLYAAEDVKKLPFYKRFFYNLKRIFSFK